MSGFLAAVRAFSKVSMLWTGRITVLSACALASAFVLASGYESVYNRSLPLVHTIDTVDVSSLERSYDLQKASDLKPELYGKFGKPVTVKIPDEKRSLRMDITDPVSHDAVWLGRASSMHLLVPKAPVNGNMSAAILYCRASFRTINASSLPAAGSNVFIDTDQKWRYVYKVTASKAVSSDYQYLPAQGSNKGKLIIYCNDAGNRANAIVEADLVTVQGVTQ